jgi:plastocyanin
MRTLVLVVAVVIAAVSLSAAPVSAAIQGPGPKAGPGPTVPLLYIRVIGESVGGKFVFLPSVILIPQVPIILNLTFYNNQSVSDRIQHTFTINDNKGNPVIDTGFVNPQVNVTVQFTINSMANVTFSNRTVTNRSFQPGPPPLGTDNGTIQWYCIPHVGLGMKGAILLASAVPAAGPEQNGIFLRAYWIGLIGIAAMLVWIGISYYIIKGSTPRFKDNRDHVRKGLP